MNDAIQLDRPHFLKPDSVLVLTALDLVASHVVDEAEGESASCRLCGLRFPCPTVLNARQVVEAGGLRWPAEAPAGHVPDGVPEQPVDGTDDRVPETARQDAPDVEAQGAEQAEEADVERASDPAGEIEDELPVPDPVGAA